MQKKWKIFLIQHSHIDVGFTERQELIETYQSQFVAQAARMAVSKRQCERSDKNKFKFTFEGFWAVEAFLKRASEEQQQEFVQGLKDGYLELSAFYFHLTELPDERLLRKSVSFARDFAEKEGVRLNTAMSCDVNGMSWAMADALYDCGVRYLSTNINIHNGGKPFDKELFPFYWESPKGNKILVWNGFSYHKANLLGIMPGFNPDMDAGIPGMLIKTKNGYVDVQDIMYAERKILPMLNVLESDGYPYDFLPLMGSGLYTDNSPATDRVCDMVEQWNRKYGSDVEIVTATLNDFFRYLEKHSKEIETYRGDWNDWWSDGVASAPIPTMVYRNAQRTRNIISMLDPKEEKVSHRNLDEIDRNLLLYSEHTFGHSSSVSYPWGKEVQQIRLAKEMYATTANILANRELDKILNFGNWGNFTARREFKYKAINPTSRKMINYIQMPVDFWEEPQLEKGVTVTDQCGKIYTYQIEQTLRGKVITVVAELSAKEERIFTLNFGEKQQNDLPSDNSSCFENAFYRLMWNESNGVFSLKYGNVEILKSGCTLARPIYQLFEYDARYTADNFHGNHIPQSEIKHGTLTSVKYEPGVLFSELKLSYDCSGTNDFIITMRLCRDIPFIGIKATITKTDVRKPEGLYIAFPFEMENECWYFDKPGGFVRPGLDQLPKTCCDYYLIQSGVILTGKEYAVAIAMPDTPMVQIGGLNLWHYKKETKPQGTLYSWLTNNKWSTNFNTSCGGFFEFNYIIEGCRKENVTNICRTNVYPFLTVRK